MKIPKFYPTIPEIYPYKKNVVGKAREFIDEFEENLKGEGIYKSLGIKPNKTFLLQSEPGLGKTFGIKALYNSLNKNVAIKIKKGKEFMSKQKKNGKDLIIPNNIEMNKLNLIMYEYDIGKYGTAYINMGSKIIQSFFNNVFLYPILGIPTLAILDEADALISSRRGNVQSHSEDRKVLETLMKNLQLAHDMDNMYVIMMTNTPEIIDEASIRAGRIDRKVTFDLPNFEERKIAYDNAINQVNDKANYKVVRAYSSEPLAEISKGFNYADIFQSIENSLRIKAKELIRTKQPGIVRAGYIKQNSLEKAVLNHKKEFKDKKNKKIGFI